MKGLCSIQEIKTWNRDGGIPPFHHWLLHHSHRVDELPSGDLSLDFIPEHSGYINRVVRESFAMAWSLLPSVRLYWTAIQDGADPRIVYVDRVWKIKLQPERSPFLLGRHPDGLSDLDHALWYVLKMFQRTEPRACPVRFPRKRKKGHRWNPDGLHDRRGRAHDGMDDAYFEALREYRNWQEVDRRARENLEIEWECVPFLRKLLASRKFLMDMTLMVPEER